MNILRRFGLSIVVSLFSLLIFVLALFVSVRFVLDTPGPLEKALSSSGIYDSFVSSIISGQKGSDSSNLPQDPGVQQALQQALTPTYLQTNTENILNNTYSWVHGTTTALTFSIDLSPIKASFADNLAAYVRQKASALPVCAQMVAPPTDLAGVMALTCRPPGVSIDQIVATAQQEAASAKLFGNSGDTLNADTLKDNSGRSLTDRLAVVPKAHRYYITSLYVIPVAIVLLGVAIVFWGKTRRDGAKHIGRTLITIGVLSIVIPVALVWLLDKLDIHLGNSLGTASGLQTHILNIVTTLASNLRMWWVIIGAGYVVAGIAILIVVRATRPKPQATSAHHQLDYARYTPPAGAKFNRGDAAIQHDDNDAASDSESTKKQK